ncbi:DUF4136 domain-containing protein [Thermodesulfobacteriota bacterium]
MKVFRIFLLLILTGLTVSCSSVYNVTHDYNPNTNFSQLNSYDWLPIPASIQSDSITINRIKAAVNSELQSKGLELNSTNPDFLIATHVGENEKIRIANYGYGYDGPYWNRSEIIAIQFPEGSLILDFVDAESKDLIWRGSAKADISTATNPEKREKLVNDAVQQILKNFPPE